MTMLGQVPEPERQKSKLVNEYGAFHGEIVNRAQGIIQDLYSQVLNLAENLDPIDKILLEKICSGCFDHKFCGESAYHGN